MLDKLKSDLPVAMKNRDTVKVSAIRRIIADLQNVEMTTGKAITEQNFVNSVKKSIKQNEEEINTRKGIEKYAEIVEVLKKEIEILEGYLPKFLSKEKIKEILSSSDNLQKVKAAKNSGAAIGVSKKLIESFGSVEGQTLKEAAEEVYNG